MNNECYAQIHDPCAPEFFTISCILENLIPRISYGVIYAVCVNKSIIKYGEVKPQSHRHKGILNLSVTFIIHAKFIFLLYNFL